MEHTEHTCGVSRRGAVLGVAAVGALAIVAGSAEAATSDRYLPQNGDWRYNVRHYDIGDTVMTSSTAAARLWGATTLHCRANTPLTDVLVDFALTVNAVYVNGRKVSFTRTTWRQIKVTGFSVAAGAAFTVNVHYNDTPNVRCRSSNHNGVYEQGSFIVFGGQPDGAIYWYPSNDRLDNMATYRISISTQATNKISGYRDGFTYYAFTSSGLAMINAVMTIAEPVASYQPGLAVGPFAVQHGTWSIGGKAVRYQFASMTTIPAALTQHTKQSLDYFAARYGAYPYSHAGGTCLNTYPVGAHEAVGQVQYRRSLVTGTYGTSYIAHENAHMWFGNSVTASDWGSVVFLHEGLVVLLENDYNRVHGGTSAYTPQPSTLGPTSGPGAIATTAAYNSAYGVQRELRRAMDGTYDQHSAPTHTRFLKALATDYSGKSINRAQFKALAQRVSGKDLGAFWSRYAV